MWGFGWKLLASGILNNVWNQLYQVVIGRFIVQQHWDNILERRSMLVCVLKILQR